VRASQARAWLVGRDYVVPEDVVDLAPDVLRHRMGLSYRAEAEGVEPGEIIDALLERVPVV
jgi:MoxR-like ATPase